MTGYQLVDDGPRAYHEYLVPAFFTACAGQLLDLVDPGPGDRLLDVACGTGVVASAAARRGAVTTGVDCNEGMLDVARSVDDGVRWELGDAAALPFPDAAFDVVTCQQGLQFVPDPAAVLAEARRVLAPGGRLGVSVWRGPDLHPVFGALATVLDAVAAGDALRGPFAGPDRDGLRALATAAGFTAVRVRIGIIPVRFASAATLLAHEAASTPAAPAVNALAEADRQAMAATFAAAVDGATDDDGVSFPMQTWHLTAHRTAR